MSYKVGWYDPQSRNRGHSEGLSRSEARAARDAMRSENPGFKVFANPPVTDRQPLGEQEPWKQGAVAGTGCLIPMLIVISLIMLVL